MNETVPEAIAEWQRSGLAAQSVQVTHQTGAAMLSQVESRYHALGINAKTHAFIEDMVAAYQWADLVICRAGAMTVSEVAAMGTPAIFIPLPTAIDDHQTANARYLTDVGAGLLLMQSELSPVTLAEHITKASKNLAAMRIAAQHSARLDATAVVADYCIAEAGL